MAVPMLTSPAIKVAMGLRSLPAARSNRLVAMLVTIIGAMRLEPQRACSLPAADGYALQALAPGQARLRGGTHTHTSVRAAHSRGPETFALQEHAVPESHSAELHRAYPFASPEGAAGSASSTFLIPLTAWRMRASFSTKAKRTKPSPECPKPMPGLTATLASLSSSLLNSSEPRWR